MANKQQGSEETEYRSTGELVFELFDRGDGLYHAPVRFVPFDGNCDECDWEDNLHNVVGIERVLFVSKCKVSWVNAIREACGELYVTYTEHFLACRRAEEGNCYAYPLPSEQ